MSYTCISLLFPFMSERHGRLGRSHPFHRDICRSVAIASECSAELPCAILRPGARLVRDSIMSALVQVPHVQVADPITAGKIEFSDCLLRQLSNFQSVAVPVLR